MADDPRRRGAIHQIGMTRPTKPDHSGHRRHTYRLRTNRVIELGFEAELNELDLGKFGLLNGAGIVGPAGAHL